MTFLDLDRIHDRYIWRPCFVCGNEVAVGEKDAGYLISPGDFIALIKSRACETCGEHGAPFEQPNDWTAEQSKQILAKIRASAPPPVVETPAQVKDPDCKKREDAIIEALARTLY